MNELLAIKEELIDIVRKWNSLNDRVSFLEAEILRLNEELNDVTLTVDEIDSNSTTENISKLNSGSNIVSNSSSPIQKH